jgi:DNA polymerase III sliding clamp (beta) subunit (PCNA family)
MTDFSIEINADILRAALICTSTEETRYYLQGVSIEPNARDLRVVSTDGHRLFCARLDVVTSVERFLIPRDALARALKGYKPKVLIVSRDVDVWRAGDIFFSPIDGVFPDSWPRIIPKDPPQEPKHAVFNPAYLVDMVKIAVVLDGKGSFPSVHADGQNPALVTFGVREDCLAVIMPLRDGAARSAQELRALVHSLTFIPTQA